MAPPASVEAGRLLVACPMLSDEPFAGTVVVLLEHDDDSGSLGVVLNRPLDSPVSDVLPEWHDVDNATPMFHGGPVGLESVLALGVLKTGHVAPPRFREVGNRWGLIDLDSEPEVAKASMHSVRIYAGYAGWAEGQLQAEVDEGAWYVVDIASDSREDLFSNEPLKLWNHVMRRQRSDLRLLLHWVRDPDTN